MIDRLARAVAPAREPAPAPAAAPLLGIDDLTKSFGGVRAVDGVTLSIGEGEFFALLGPSGCGKTTLMRLIAGLEAADGGSIRIGGEDMTIRPAHLRPVNMMFQSYALFPHLSVARNVAFGLEQARRPRAEIARRVAELLRLVQLEGLEARKPAQLSGGQKQRVALARALARDPKLLLLDEPLAALDRKLREETQAELRDVQRRLGASFMLVTHDQGEAMAMADRIAVMRDGRIEQIGAPREIYEEPASRWVACFIGETNLFEVAAGAQSGGRILLLGDEGETFEMSAANCPLALGERAALALRPERVRLSVEPPRETPFAQGAIVDATFRGEATHWRVALDSGSLVRASRSNSDASATEELTRGARVFLSCAPDAGRVLTQ